jgi:hypothetical protein
MQQRNLIIKMADSEEHAQQNELNIQDEMTRIIKVIEESKQNMTTTQFNVTC